MSKVVSLRFNDDEEFRVLAEIMKAGDRNISAHIKRVYLEAIGRDAELVEKMNAQLEGINSNLRYLIERENTNEDLQVFLSLISGLYVMVRRSVSDGIRSEADEYIDVKVVENYLKETKS